jgi:(methylthio)acryloyl-CoA hydratase
VRLPPLIGVARVMDMMLTGRTLSAEEGQLIGLTDG